MRLLLLLAAAVVAVFAGVAALQLSNKPAAPAPAVVEQPQTVSTVDVLVAREPISLGTVIKQEMLDVQPWPENLVLKGFIINGGTDANIVGKVARSAFNAREPIMSSQLASTDEAGFLAATLPVGRRAITISTDAISGVAGFIFPGDHVDVVFTHNLLEMYHVAEAANSNKPTITTNTAYSEILVPNAPVLAVNLREIPPAEGAAPPTPPSSISPSSLTIEVSAEDAEAIRLAEKNGTLSVALRSLQDRDGATPIKPVDLSNITQIVVPSLEADSVRVIRR